MVKWVSCVASTYQYGTIDCILLSFNVQVSEWIHALWFAWMSRNSLLKADAIYEVLRDSNKIRTHNHVVPKRTLKHLAKLSKWLSRVVSTNLYCAFDLCSCHFTYAFYSECKLYSLSESQGTPCSNQSYIWSFKWRRDLNPQSLSS